MSYDKKELEFNYPKYDGSYNKPRYFKIEILVEIPSNDTKMPALSHLNWGSGCDETFAMLSFVPKKSHLLDYQEVSESFFNQHKYDLLDEEGGM